MGLSQAGINIVQKIGNLAELDFGLVANPTFAPSYVSIYSKGEFLNPQNPVVCSFVSA